MNTYKHKPLPALKQRTAVSAWRGRGGGERRVDCRSQRRALADRSARLLLSSYIAVKTGLNFDAKSLQNLRVSATDAA